MFKVDVLNLRSDLEQLADLLAEYEVNYLNIYYQIQSSETESYWIDYHSKLFFEDKASEKVKIEKSHDELKSIYTYSPT